MWITIYNTNCAIKTEIDRFPRSAKKEFTIQIVLLKPIVNIDNRRFAKNLQYKLCY